MVTIPIMKNSKLTFVRAKFFSGVLSLFLIKNSLNVKAIQKNIALIEQANTSNIIHQQWLV